MSYGLCSDCEQWAALAITNYLIMGDNYSVHVCKALLKLSLEVFQIIFIT